MNATKAAVEAILTKADSYEWSVQGLGMMRTYLDGPGGTTRLHIWHDGLLTPGVSSIHDHPWAFTSFVVAGRILNRRFVEHAGPCPYDTNGDGDCGKRLCPYCGIDSEYQKVQIRCGEGGGMLAAVTTTHLVSDAEENYHEGDSYAQRADELHCTGWENGSVTIIIRTAPEWPPSPLATVCWRSGPWVSAEPRPATAEEVDKYTTGALTRWFK